MSSSVQATSPYSNFQLITNALADYAKLTGIDLTKSLFAEKIEHSNSPEAVLALLQEREKAFREYRDVNRRLISCLSPAVKVLYAFSGIAGDVFGLVSVTYHYCESFNVASSGALLTSKRCIYQHRCSPCRMSVDHDLQLPGDVRLVRLLVALPRVMTLFSNFSNAWGILSSALRYI